MKIVQMNVEGVSREGSGIMGLLGCLAIRILVTKAVGLRNLDAGTLWRCWRSRPDGSIRHHRLFSN